MIYFDNKATTVIDPKVLDAMLPFLKENYANPSSAHYFGMLTSEAVRDAKVQIADLMCAEKKTLKEEFITQLIFSLKIMMQIC